MGWTYFFVENSLLEEDAPTYGAFSAVIAEQIAAMEAVSPPDAVTDFHHKVGASLRPLKDLLDERPENEEGMRELDELLTSMVETSRAEALLSMDACNRLLEAGCIEGTPDEHGNDPASATEIEVGESPVEGELQFAGDTDFFRFRAEAGESYVIRLPLSFLGLVPLLFDLPSSPSLVLYDSGGLELESIHEDFTDEMYWEAPSSGDFYVAIGDPDSTGSYALAVNLAASDPIAVGAIDEYVSLCQTWQEVELEETATYGEHSAAAGQLIEAMGSKTTPPEVADWHRKTLILLQEGKGLVDSRPKDDAFNSFIVLVLLPLVGVLQEAEANLPPDTLERLVEAGCIEDDSFGEPETSLGTFSVGEAPRVGDYQIWVSSYSQGPPHQGAPGETRVDITIANVGERALASPDCDRHMSLQDQTGARYDSIRCQWPGDDEIPPGGEGDYYLAYRPPEDATGLVCKFSAYTVGVDFALDDAVVDITDDHGDTAPDATAVTVGTAVQGAVDYDGDEDFFAFQAVEGELYQIDVAPGTLFDSALTLRDANERFMDSSNYHGDSRASRIHWRAPASGSYYVAVSDPNLDYNRVRRSRAEARFICTL